jgi:hypothetical protein
MGPGLQLEWIAIDSVTREDQRDYVVPLASLIWDA